MTRNRAAFFDFIRMRLFKGKLGAGQVQRPDAILDLWRARTLGGRRDGWPMGWRPPLTKPQPPCSPCARRCRQATRRPSGRLDRAVFAGGLGSVKTPSWRPDTEGRSWLGRGLVQRTHKRNYEAMSKVTGIDLVGDPSRAMEWASPRRS